MINEHKKCIGSTSLEETLAKFTKFVCLFRYATKIKLNDLKNGKNHSTSSDSNTMQDCNSRLLRASTCNIEVENLLQEAKEQLYHNENHLWIWRQELESKLNIMLTSISNCVQV